MFEAPFPAPLTPIQSSNELSITMPETVNKVKVAGTQHKAAQDDKTIAVQSCHHKQKNGQH